MRQRRPITRTQAICLLLFWVLLCFFVLTSAVRIDGPLILSVLISGALVFIPLYKALRSDKREK
ncbi:MAG: hypothetical protein IJ417_03300 [Bacteroidaceae bacterium]|nr:hypothetical protein [Bacteroidaceae bacterium]